MSRTEQNYIVLVTEYNEKHPAFSNNSAGNAVKLFDSLAEQKRKFTTNNQQIFIHTTHHKQKNAAKYKLTKNKYYTAFIYFCISLDLLFACF